MTPEHIDRITVRYPSAGAWDRFHLKHRLRLCPYDELLPFIPASGRILDIGCGFGLLGWFLAETRPRLEYWGADVDRRKIELARRAFAHHPDGDRAHHLHAGDVTAGAGGGSAGDAGAGDASQAAWSDRPAHFDAVAILDVLYLLPVSLQRKLFDFSCDLLGPAPGAVLLLKILPPLRGGARLRTWIQESLMVRVLRKTQGSGALFASQDPELYAAWGRARGLTCREVALPTAPPSTLLVLRRPER